MPGDSKAIVFKYFSKHGAEIDGKWKCTCGKILTQKRSTGWTNLFNHIKTQHSEYNQSQNQDTLQNYFNSGESTSKGSNVYSWLRWICMGLKPFNFVEDHLNRHYTRLQPISENSLKKYIDLVTKEVETRISSILPDKFAIIIDGWSKSSNHFVGVFASFASDNEPCGYQTVMLAFSPMLTEESFTAKDHFDFLTWVLQLFEKSFQNVVAICGDNVEVNKCLANMCNLPLIGCASHRFNLGVEEFLKPNEAILCKVNQLMGKLKNLKLSGKLRKYTELRPIQRNDTRWLSTCDMIVRFQRLKQFFVEPDIATDPHIVELLPTPKEMLLINSLNESLARLRSITVALQRENLDLSESRFLFQQILQEPQYFPMKKYLDVNATIIHNPVFETAICKIQEGKENTLGVEEEGQIDVLKRSCDVVEIQNISAEDEDDFASHLLKKRKIEKRRSGESRESKYLSTKFLLPTSNILERFFSKADYAFSDYRQRLLPQNLEMQLFLNVNSRFWDEKTVSKCLNK